jgi:geranylgeranyl pyrophosphate synthase
MTQQKIINLTEKERLKISIYKGGLSVLIDRYLINKTLAEEDIIFYLSFGFFLQLADDLLDIREDIETGSQTIFSLDVSSEHLELLVNKLFAYVHNLFSNYTSINENFKDFVLKNCYYLILYGVSENKEVLSKAYLNKLEKYFPVHYSYLDDLKVSIQQLNATVKQSNYMKLLDDFLINYTKVL